MLLMEYGKKINKNLKSIGKENKVDIFCLRVIVYIFRGNN